MRHIFKALTATILVGLASLSAAAQAGTAAGAEKLVRAVYADSSRPTSSRADPLWWRSLSKRTRALHGRVTAWQVKTGDLYLDYDFLCQCQDNEGLRIKSLKVNQVSPTTATVAVTFSAPGWNETPRLTLLLVDEAGWKIDDMIDKSGKHFIKLLNDTILDYRKEYPRIRM